MKTNMKTRNWKMPEWMLQYLPLLDSGSSTKWVEELYNDDGTNSNVFNNAPRALICVAMKSKIALLLELHEMKFLRKLE